MSSFGQSHRQLVEDTNEGAVQPTARESTATKANLGAQQTRRVGGEDFQGVQALVDVGSTLAEPVVREANRKKERDGYDAAGKEEGQKAADSASKVWHNKLFGADASLRGAQTRIAEDNARNLYLEAQDLLENGGADSWDDETWADWKEEKISDEVGKYDSQDMRDHINSTMGQDFQKLERDRSYLHQQYNQAESRNATLGGLNTIAKTFNADRGSSNPNRSEEDAVGRLEEIQKLKTESGMSDKAFASAVAQTAANEYSEGKDDFGKYAKEQGFFDDLEFEDQMALDAAQRIHEMKHDEAYGERSEALYGHQGFIARGDISGALEHFDEMARDYPESIPEGGRNAIRAQVHQAAWGHAEQARIQKERQQFGKQSAGTGIWQPQAVTDEFGNTTYKEVSSAEKLYYTQMYVAEHLEGQFHEDQTKADANYERRDMTSQERQDSYMNNAAFLGEVQEKNGILLPEVQAAASSMISTINHGMDDMTPGQTEAFKNNLDNLMGMTNNNFATRNMMSEELGMDHATLEYVHKEMNAGKTPREINNALQMGKGQLPASATSGTVSGAGSYASGEVPKSHQPSRSQVRQANAAMRSGMDEGGFGPFRRLKNDDERENIYRQYYSEGLTEIGSTSQSAKDRAHNSAIGRMNNESAIISTGNGKEMIHGLGTTNAQVQDAGWDNIDHVLKTAGDNQDLLDDIESETGVRLTSMFGNPLTSEGIGITPLPNGDLALHIPREDQEDGIYVMKIPHKDDAVHLPPEQVLAGERIQAGMQYVDNPEEWTSRTGQKQTPRQEMDDELRKQYIAMNYPLLLGGPERTKLQKAVTQQQLDEFMPAHEYNKALRNRETNAVTKAVKKQHNKEINAASSPRALWKAHKERRAAKKEQSTVKEQLNDIGPAPELPFYREGDNSEDLKKKEDQAWDMWRGQRDEIRRSNAEQFQ